MDLTPGSLLERGKYRIIDTLGRGGFGITYLAEQVMAKRKVCIKEFFPKDYYKRDEDTSALSLFSESNAEVMGKFKAKFIKEAQTIASLDHSNIIHIHDVFEENGTAYYVMEYVEGGSLRDIVKEQGPLSESDAKRYIRAVASALGYIHEQKINHLDVKPGNIMVRTKDDSAILIDFGLSKHYDIVGDQTSSTPVGISHGYAPIEQYTSGGVREFSPSTDIYGLGATLYYLVTGEVPPHATDVGEEGLPKLPDHLSQGVRKAIERSMQYWRKDRPQSVKEFLKLLDDDKIVAPVAEATIINVETKSVDESTVINVKPKQTPQTAPKNEPKPKKSKRGLWLGIFLFVVAAVASFILFGGGSKESKQIDRTEQMRQDSIARAQFMADSTAKAERELFVRDSTAKAERELFVRDSIAQVECEKSIRDSVNRANAEKKRLEEERKADAAARAKASLQLTNDSAALTYEAGNHEISFTLKSPYEGLKVTAEANQDWITIDDVGNKNIYYSVKKNTSKADRKATITVKYNDKLYKYTVTQSSIEKFYVQGKTYYNKGDYTEAVKYFKQAAEEGYVDAQNDLGYCYDKGYGVPQDYKEAVKWYRKAAEQGNAYAQFNLGYCYYYGDGVTQDYNEVVKWFSKAAEQGNAYGQNGLGYCYENGYGVTKNIDTAVEWYRKAAQQGNKTAQDNLKGLGKSW